MPLIVDRFPVTPASVDSLVCLGHEGYRDEIVRATTAGRAVELLVARLDDRAVASALLEHPECVPGNQAAADVLTIVDFQAATNGDPAISAALLEKAAAPLKTNPEVTLRVNAGVLGDTIVPIAQEVGFVPHGRHTDTLYLTAAGLDRALRSAA